MPDLNLDNEAVRNEIKDIRRYRANPDIIIPMIKRNLSSKTGFFLLD